MNSQMRVSSAFPGEPEHAFFNGILCYVTLNLSFILAVKIQAPKVYKEENNQISVLLLGLLKGPSGAPHNNHYGNKHCSFLEHVSKHSEFSCTQTLKN